MEEDRAVYLDQYRPWLFDIHEVSLSFELMEDHAVIQSELRMSYKRPVVGGEAATSPLELNGLECNLQGIYMDGRPLKPTDDYTLAPNPKGSGVLLTVLKPSYAAPSFTLGVVTTCNPAANTSCEGLYLSSGCFITQCEAESFRRISFFPDRPDALGKKWTTKIVADKAKYPVLLGNGNLVASGDLQGGRHYTIWVDPWTKPCYLFCIVAGNLVANESTFTTCKGNEVALKIWTEEHNKTKTDWAMESLKRAFKWDEKRWGRVYDLDLFNVVVVDNFNMGAMENKSLNVFNSRLVLATPESATDLSYYRIEGIIGHEYFHNWSGNRVTCRDWFQLSLKEGLTVFRDQEFTSDMNSREVKRIDDIIFMRREQFSEDAGAMAHRVRPHMYEAVDNLYSSTVYEKGAEVIRMYQTILGREGFCKGLYLYFERHDGQAVTCDDFYNAMMQANDYDGGNFILWYSQAGTPAVSVTHKYDAAAKEVTFTVKQTLPTTPADLGEKKPMMIPVAVGLLGPDGADLEITCVRSPGQPDLALAPGTKTAVLLLRDAEATFVLPGIPHTPVPSVLRNWSAPVKLTTDLTDEQVLFLLAHDADAVNRWDASQTLASQLMLSAAKTHKIGEEVALPPSFVGAFRNVLTDKTLDQGFVVRVLDLPAVEELVGRTEGADPVLLYYVRRGVMCALADALKDELTAVFESCTSDEPYKPDVAGMGRRALRLKALEYLSARGTPAGRALCVEAHRGARNMTEKVGALRCLCLHAGAEREDALAAFHEEWRGDMLCTCTWLRLQSACELGGNVGRVRALLSHPSFDLKSPNKCYALARAFTASSVNFHAADGSGYAFLADAVLMMDKVNPQVAARCVADFSCYQSYDPARQALMLAELRRIAAAGPSNNVAEIVTRSLKQAEAS